MKKTLFFLLVLNVPAAALSAEQMALLDDEELSDVSARQGIALNFEMHYQCDAECIGRGGTG